MKKVVIRDIESFHAWQARTVKSVDDKCQMAISTIPYPREYPIVLVWNIREESDIESTFPNALTDIFEYKYIYIGDFPVRCIKKGIYIYQVFQTNDDISEI